MKWLRAVSWRSCRTSLAVIAALAMPVLAGCDSTVRDGARDTTVGEAVSGTAVPQVTDDVGTALSPTPTAVAAPSPTPTAVVAPSPMPTVVAALSPRPTVEAIYGHPVTPCIPEPHPWLVTWFWDNTVRWRGDGSTILFSVGPVVYAAKADGAQVSKVADATTTVQYGGYSVLGPMTSYDVTRKGDGIVYATCAYQWKGLQTERQKELAALGAAASYGYELAVVGVDGMDPRRLTGNGRFDNYPSWSPDGTRIAFLTGGNGRSGSDLAVIAADGSERPEFESDKGIVLHPPQWSPDGERLAVVGTDGNVRMLAIYTIGADGSDKRRLGAAASGPAWSPDGTRIAFATDEGDEIALYTMAPDGTDARKVPLGPRWAPRYEASHDVLVGLVEVGLQKWITTLEWSPGGDRLLYSCGLRVCVGDLDGNLVGESPVTFETGRGSVAAWSPDGSRIAVGQGVAWPTEDRRRDPLDGEIALYSMAPDGSDVQILAAHSDARGVIAVGARERAALLDVSGCAPGLAWAVANRRALNLGLAWDCQTLLEIRDELAGTTELDWWRANRPITEWSGVVVGGSPRRVEWLQLSGRGMDGRIRPELSKLTGLVLLDLSDNSLVGGIPNQLSRLTELRWLDVSNNELTGEIPAELGRLQKLEALDLSNNRLSGRIPPLLWDLTNLRVLNLSHNRLTSAIPGTQGRLYILKESLLSELLLSNNELTGMIPSELGDIPMLRLLRLSGNRLMGCVPAELRRVESNDLDELELPNCE